LLLLVLHRVLDQALIRALIRACNVASDFDILLRRVIAAAPGYLNSAGSCAGFLRRVPAPGMYLCFVHISVFCTSRQERIKLALLT
jgi:hypothetical protein